MSIMILVDETVYKMSVIRILTEVLLSSSMSSLLDLPFVREVLTIK